MLVFPCLLSGEDNNTTDYRSHCKDCECVCKMLRIVPGIWTCSVNVSFSVESSSVSGYTHACGLSAERGRRLPTSHVAVEALGHFTIRTFGER